jgi:hypothetical protein
MESSREKPHEAIFTIFFNKAFAKIMVIFDLYKLDDLWNAPYQL